jgi:phenylacetate-CoA ligase
MTDTLRHAWSGGWGMDGYDPWAAATMALEVWSSSNSAAVSLRRRTRDRLDDLLTSAALSPFYRRLHGSGTLSGARGKNVPLERLEPVTRARLMAAFDDWCTDREVNHSAVSAFAADPRRVGEPFLGRYAVWTSSGTTGTPGIYVQDARSLAIYDALETLRFRGLQQLGGIAGAMARLTSTPWDGGERFAMVGATGGHFAGNASVERMRRMSPWAAARVRVVSIMQATRRIVDELNAYRPTVIATYPTAAELLATEQAAGRLRLDLDEIWTGGEQLSEPARYRIEQTFGCRVRNGYGASEFMAIAWDCGHGALHVNSDWVVLEPVDAQYRAVPLGTPSHTVLLTNLANHVQPLIRYDLGDSVTMLPGCACGSHFPAIHVEGRCDDALHFERNDGEVVTLLPLALVTVLEDDAGIHDFQLVQTGPRTLALRLGDNDDSPAGGDVGSDHRSARRILHQYLAAQGVRNVRIIEDPEPPAREPRSGKLRRVVRALAHGNARRPSPAVDVTTASRPILVPGSPSRPRIEARLTRPSRIDQQVG